MAVWELVLEHKNGIDMVEIIAVGNDPHEPHEIIKKSKGSLGKRVLETIEKEVKERPMTTGPVPFSSRKDLYWYAYIMGEIIDNDDDWVIRCNLPDPELPESEHGETVII